MRRNHIILFLLFFSLGIVAQERQIVSMPRQEQLASERVLQIMQDSEGFIWYATEGGGLCRDNGRQITVFRSDAEHPDLLGSNDVSCVAEASEQFIIIGTFHGAYVMDKHDYSIRRLTEVDDKRVDDILISKKTGHWWITANKKIYEFDDKGTLLATLPISDKYIARLYEDSEGRIWFSEWDGGLWRLPLSDDIEASPANLWTLDVAPSAIVSIPQSGDLWIGTIGHGIVRYHANDGTFQHEQASGNAVCIDMLLDADEQHLWLCAPTGLLCFNINEGQLTSSGTEYSGVMGRLSLDNQGRLLVAVNNDQCFALTGDKEEAWWNGQRLLRTAADSIRLSYGLSARPTALVFDKDSLLWFSTGKDIRRKTPSQEEVVLSDTKDVSAMTFSADGTLWLATIFGTVMTYRDGQLSTDDYASNEYGDAIVDLQTDSLDRIVIVSDRFVRLYDHRRKTLRQQNIENEGVYRIELQETAPGKRWNQPEEKVVERMPQWVWMLLGVLSLLLIALLGYIGFLHRQRRRFMEAMKKLPAQEQADINHQSEEETTPISPTEVQSDDLVRDEWLQKAIATVEKNLADEHYSVEQLSTDLCMSRMTFYRKIQTATGQKPTEFIRTIRLRRAAELLREGRHTITEISCDTGFSSVSYFSRCFRTMFGVPPTLFGKNTTAEDLPSSEMPS